MVVNVTQIYAMGNGRITGYFPKNIYVAAIEELEILGKYATEERALQVLDEIQEHIKSQENEHNYNLALAKQGTYSTTYPTFEMPAE